MRTAAATVLVLSVQLLLGAALHAVVGRLLARRPRGRGGVHRRWVVAWSRSTRALLRLAPFAAAALLTGAIVAPSGISSTLRDVWFQPVRFVGLGVLPTAALWPLLQAARWETRGRLLTSRVQCRLAGELVFVGAFALLVFVWSQVIFDVPIRRALVESMEGAGLLLLGGTVMMGCGAFIALLAGLAGKPRPSSWFAALFYVSGLATLIAAHQIAST